MRSLSRFYSKVCVLVLFVFSMIPSVHAEEIFEGSFYIHEINGNDHGAVPVWGALVTLPFGIVQADDLEKVVIKDDDGNVVPGMLAPAIYYFDGMPQGEHFVKRAELSFIPSSGGGKELYTFTFDDTITTPSSPLIFSETAAEYIIKTGPGGVEGRIKKSTGELDYVAYDKNNDKTYSSVVINNGVGHGNIIVEQPDNQFDGVNTNDMKCDVDRKSSRMVRIFCHSPTDFDFNDPRENMIYYASDRFYEFHAGQEEILVIVGLGNYATENLQTATDSSNQNQKYYSVHAGFKSARSSYGLGSSFQNPSAEITADFMRIIDSDGDEVTFIGHYADKRLSTFNFASGTAEFIHVPYDGSYHTMEDLSRWSTRFIIDPDTSDLSNVKDVLSLQTMALVPTAYASRVRQFSPVHSMQGFTNRYSEGGTVVLGPSGASHEGFARFPLGGFLGASRMLVDTSTSGGHNPTLTSIYISEESAWSYNQAVIDQLLHIIRDRSHMSAKDIDSINPDAHTINTFLNTGGEGARSRFWRGHGTSTIAGSANGADQDNLYLPDYQHFWALPFMEVSQIVWVPEAVEALEGVGELFTFNVIASLCKSAEPEIKATLDCTGINDGFTRGVPIHIGGGWGRDSTASKMFHWTIELKGPDDPEAQKMKEWLKIIADDLEQTIENDGVENLWTGAFFENGQVSRDVIVDIINLFAFSVDADDQRIYDTHRTAFQQFMDREIYVCGFDYHDSCDGWTPTSSNGVSVIPVAAQFHLEDGNKQKAQDVVDKLKEISGELLYLGLSPMESFKDSDEPLGPVEFFRDITTTSDGIYDTIDNYKLWLAQGDFVCTSFCEEGPDGLLAQRCMDLRNPRREGFYYKSCEPSCTPGESRECGNSNVGECSFGTQVCDNEGFWGTCEGEVLPSIEVEDGLDNDCDNFVDEGIRCDLGPSNCPDRGRSDGSLVCFDNKGICTDCADIVSCADYDAEISCGSDACGLGCQWNGICEQIPVCNPVDSDGDGVIREHAFCSGAFDCNDEDDTIFPGATEVCGDGIDQDCDGSDDACPSIFVYEAEDMILSGYDTETRGEFDNGIGIKLPTASSTGTASFTYNGPSGVASVTIKFVAENDGNPTVTFSRGSEELIVFNYPTVSASFELRTQTFEDIVVVSGDVIEIEGVGESNAFARIDAVEILSVQSESCEGDTNLDSVVNIFDILGIAGAFGVNQGETGYVQSLDVDSSGQINIFDLIATALRLGTSC